MGRRSIQQLQTDITKVIGYHRWESHLTFAEIVGVLEIIKFNLLQEESMQVEEDEEQE